MRATIDTNSVVSAVLYPGGYPGRVLTAWEADRFTLVTSEPCLMELEDVLLRPRLRIDPAKAHGLLLRMRRMGDVVAITGAPQGCVDPDDDRFIETAVTGRAGFLVSADRHLLQMTIPGVLVLGAATFFLRLPSP